MKKVYEEIMQNPNMITFMEAQQELSDMVQEINARIQFFITGEEPTACDGQLCLLRRKLRQLTALPFFDSMCPNRAATQGALQPCLKWSGSLRAGAGRPAIFSKGGDTA